MKKIIYFIILTLFISLSSCQTQPQVKDAGKINIVATIFPEYDFARAIAKDKVNLSMLMPPGASIHSFDPSPADIKNIQNADIFIYIGGESDEWASNILESFDTTKMKIVKLLDYVNKEEEEIKEGMEEEKHEEHELSYDEHIWTSPKNALRLIEVIRDAIIEKDPENREFYTENAQSYQDELKDISNEIQNIVSDAKHKKIIVADKFPFLYFVNHYGLDYEAAFPGCSDQADAGAKTIAHLVNSVKTEGISYIYHVELSNKNVAEAISEQTGAEMLLLNSCHNLSREDFEKGVTYLSLMKDNAENLRKGLN